MFKLIDTLLGKSRSQARISRVEHLDARLLADIGLTREDFRRSPKRRPPDCKLRHALFR